MSASSQPVPILMYHSISRSGTPPFRRFTLDPALLRAQLSYLVEHRFEALTVSRLAELATSPTGVVTMPRKPVVLTFDDGFEDFYTEALPLLDHFGLTATLFVITGFVGGTSRWLEAEGEGHRPIVSWSQLREIAAQGIECAAHTHTHPQLDNVPVATVRDELRRPKLMMEDRLQCPVRSFAYPYGYYSRTVRELVVAAGYRSACTVKDLVGPVGGHLMPRLTVNAGTDVTAFADLLGQIPRGVASRAAVEAKRVVWQGVRRYGPARVTGRTASGMPTRLAGSRS